ncbi:MAG: chromophore lyase CpcT/CpeT [Congregibacter sp.]
MIRAVVSQICVGLLLVTLASACAPVGTGVSDATTSPSASSSSPTNLEAELALFLAWFAGEFDNNEQVWQQRADGLAGEDLHERIHHRFVPIPMPQLGEQVFFVLQTLNDDLEQVYRQRIYSFDVQPEVDAIRLTIYRMQDEERYRNAWQDPSLLESLSVDMLSTVSGCEVYWRYNGEFFDGTMTPGACHFTSPRSGKEIYITDTLRLTESEIWIGDKAEDADGNYVFGREEPHINRKVRRFKGWMGVRKSRVDPAYTGDDMFFTGDFSIHSEGGRQSILDDDGKQTGFGIELAQLTYQNTRVPILKLGLIDEKTGKTLVYSWAATDSSRVGINVRWFQAGLTALED